jgi:hypothetical protein
MPGWGIWRGTSTLSEEKGIVIMKRERAIKICSGRVWGQGVPQQAHAEASLPPPPEIPATQWYSIEQSLLRAWEGELRE